MNFTYESKQIGKVLIIYPKGRILDKSEAEELITVVEEKIKAGINKILMNFREIEYINSAGLSVLITILTQSRNNYGELLLCNVPDKISKLLVTSKLHNIFNVVYSEDEAIKALTN